MRIQKGTKTVNRVFLIRTSIILLTLLSVIALLTQLRVSSKAATLPHTPTNGAGANLPYLEYEAEDASTNGTIIGPSRNYLEVAAEASGRKAVKLDTTGQFVEFTLTASANSIVIRFNIPDAPAGGGITAPINLYINGNHSQDISLTSKYEWVYGHYPYFKNPSLGLAHRFFDEVRLRIGEQPTGTRIKLQKDANASSPYYIIDLVDMEEAPAALPMPANFLSITDFNAVSGGGVDNAVAIQNASNAAQQQSKGLWIPPGNFMISAIVNFTGVTVRGAGPWYSIVSGHLAKGGLDSSGGNTSFYDLAIFGDVSVRDDSNSDAGIEGTFGTGSVIQNVWIEHTKVGMWIKNSTNGLHATQNRIKDTFADGVNINTGSQNVLFDQNIIRNTGDDGMAMWSWNIGPPDVNNVFSHNTIQLPILANGIGLYGGTGNQAVDNLILDTVFVGAGISITNDFGSVNFSGTTTIARNTLIRTGSLKANADMPDPNGPIGAIRLYTPNSSITAAINISDMTINDSSYAGMTISGPNAWTNGTLTNVAINGTGSYAIQVFSDASGSISLTNVTAIGVPSGKINNASGGRFTLNGTVGAGGPTATTCICTPTNTDTPTQTPIPLNLVTAINAGGSAVGSFSADRGFDSGNVASTGATIDTNGVANPAPQAIYQTLRWNSAFAYTIPGLTAGSSYTVRLHFAEQTFGQNGNRQFNVAINGTTVLSNFDVFATAGATNKAVEKIFTTTANGSGQIIISFSRGAADNPMISGIEVLTTRNVGPSPTPTATKPASNTATPTRTSIAMTLVKAINAGGGAVGNFSADTGFDTGNTATTGATINTSGVANPAPQGVYQTLRWNSAFNYTISGLTAGSSYTVRLHFAEQTFGQVGNRRFNVAINGVSVLSNFDVFATSGATNKAVEKIFTTTPNGSGQIVIAFTPGSNDNPMISGIEILH